MEETSEAAIDNTNKKSKSCLSGNKCVLPHCGKSKRTDPHLKIFRFPYLDTLLLNVWMRNCNLEQKLLERPQTLYICEKHFTPDCVGKKYLKRSAVPTLNLTDKNDDIIIGIEIDNGSLSVPCKPKELKPPPVCENCQKNLKNAEFHSKRYSSTLKKLKDLRDKKHSFQKKNYTLKKRIARLEKRIKNSKTIEVQIDNADIHPNEKIFCKMLLKQNRGNNARWDDNETNLAKSIFQKSTLMYKFLRNKLNLNLPSTSSLSRWKNRGENLQAELNLSTNIINEDAENADDLQNNNTEKANPQNEDELI